jgi:hypothetical protein
MWNLLKNEDYLKKFESFLGTKKKRISGPQIPFNTADFNNRP